MCVDGCGQPDNCECERPRERNCSACGLLILVPGRAYEIDPRAVCKCKHRDPSWLVELLQKCKRRAEAMDDVYWVGYLTAALKDA